jgi:hypothetical protein
VTGELTKFDSPRYYRVVTGLASDFVIPARAPSCTTAAVARLHRAQSCGVLGSRPRGGVQRRRTRGPARRRLPSGRRVSGALRLYTFQHPQPVDRRRGGRPVGGRCRYRSAARRGPAPVRAGQPGRPGPARIGSPRAKTGANPAPHDVPRTSSRRSTVIRPDHRRSDGSPAMQNPGSPADRRCPVDRPGNGDAIDGTRPTRPRTPQQRTRPVLAAPAGCATKAAVEQPAVRGPIAATT